MKKLVTLKLELEIGTLRAGGEGTVTGVLYFATDGDEFPDSGWNDFVVVVLSWWCTALSSLTAGISRRELLRFMDGPFAVQANWGPEDGSVRLSFMRRSQIVASGEIDQGELLRQVTTAAQQVLTFCERVGVSGADVEHLREGVLSLCAH